MIFTLKQYDFELLTFELRQEGLDGFACSVLSVNEANRKLLPIGMSVDGEGVLAWLRSRIIPRNREYVDKILSVYGLSHNNLLGIIKLSLGLSLNDSYWCVPEGFSGRFSEFNLYENPFNKALALIAYTGFGSVRPSGFSSSPEFTTNGNLRKGWRKVNGQILLYKGGSSGAANTGNEPYSEYYAAQVASAMSINHVPYNLAKWKGVLCSTCPLFTDIDHSFVSAHRFFPKLKLTEIAAELKKMGDTFYQSFCDMIVFDALVCNTDRHLGNFGLMIDNKRNKPVAFAPLFDNGMALFPFAMKDDFDDLNRYAATRLSAYDVPFSELVSAFMTNRQRRLLRKLADFRFERHRYYNLPAWRLKKLEAFIHDRVHELISLSEGKAT
jgi:hypothetical protein